MVWWVEISWLEKVVRNFNTIWHIQGMQDIEAWDNLVYLYKHLILYIVVAIEEWNNLGKDAR